MLVLTSKFYAVQTLNLEVKLQLLCSKLLLEEYFKLRVWNNPKILNSQRGLRE